MSMIRAVSSYSSAGLREAQEDFTWFSAERGIFALADGFGGPESGLQAAKSACHSVQRFLEKEAGDLEATLPFILRRDFSLAGNVLFNALIIANREVLALNQNKSIHEKGGASLLAGLLDGNLFALANIGCCNSWLFRSGKEVELVVPRSYARLVDPFSKSDSSSPFFQTPLSSLGMDEFLEPEITEFRVRSGDWLLLQTDGLKSDVRRLVLEIQQKKFKVSRSIEEFQALLKSESPHAEDNLLSILVIF